MKQLPGLKKKKMRKNRVFVKPVKQNKSKTSLTEAVGDLAIGFLLFGAAAFLRAAQPQQPAAAPQLAEAPTIETSFEEVK